MRENDENAQTGWSTQDEVRFLEALGTFSVKGPLLNLESLLRGYLRGVRQRDIWGRIDRTAVLQYVEQRLAKIKNKSEEE